MAMTMPLSLRNKLKTLCACGDGWSYAIFWRFHKTNPMLLTVEESYYKEQLGEEIAKLLPQVHLLGEGIVGEAAFSDKHNWLHSVSYEDDSGLYQQFSSGIKTIVVIPIKSWGVVQFGSTNKILETINFLDQTQSLLKEIDDMDMIEVSGNELLPMDFANYDLNGLLASISTENSCDWTLKYTLDENYDELREVYSSTNPNDPFSSQHKTCEETSSLSDQLNGTIEAYLDPDSSMNDNLISKTSLFGEWCGENSSFDSLGQQFASEIMAQEVVDVCTSFDSSIVHDSAFVSLDKGSSFQDNHSSEPVVVTDVVLPSSSIEPVDMSEEFLKLSSLDDLCQWFAPSTDDSICTTMIQLDNNLPESIEFNPTLAEHNTITTIVNSEMKETSVLIHSSENDFLDNLELDLGCDQSSEWWGNLLTPMVSTATDIGFSECISELNYTTTLTDNRKRLFSELGGIEELLKGQANYNNPFNSSNFENELLSSNKRQMVEFSSMSRTQVNFASLVGAEAGPNLMQSVSDLEKSNSVLTKKDTFPKLQVGMLINDRNSINMKRGVSLHPKKQEEPTKPTKKKAKPGESTRPRPKDRQQIQDCIKELRGIIPHGGKCSIDSLLDRTIRYMLFLRSVIKYADMMHEPNEPKLIEQANGVVPKDSENRGATWAFEVGNQTMVCPIIVEDMNPPGQMLIEMLCEDQGFFLEIVDIIKGFGLNILKAKMEIKKSKLWGRFIVEANRHVTRIDVFWSLIHLLQQPNITGSDSSNKHSNVIDANIA